MPLRDRFLYLSASEVDESKEERLHKIYEERAHEKKTSGDHLFGERTKREPIGDAAADNERKRKRAEA